MSAASDDLFRALARSTRALVIRVDDVGLADRAALSFVDQLAAMGHVVNAAVVPAYAGNAEWLANVADRHPGAIEVHQHGWSHSNYETEGRKSEFGPARSAGEMEADLVNGRRRLEQTFGTMFVPVFCPPWNRMSSAAAELCRNLGFIAVTGFGSLPPCPPLRDVSATVDVTRACRAHGEPGDGFVLSLCDVLASGASPRVMIHPEVLADSERSAVLDVFGRAARSGVLAAPLSRLVTAASG